MPRADKAARLEYQRELYASHREEAQRKRKERYASDDEFRRRTLERNREVYYPRQRAKKLARTKELNQEQKLQVLSHYSQGTLRCARCGITDIDVLSLDHINGGGTQHRKLNPHSYRWALRENFPEGFQVLCFNCNWKKRLFSKQINKGEN